MYFIIIDWTIVGSAERDQHIGPFLSRKDAEEWGYQIIGDPEGLPWSVEELDSPTSCVKQFKHDDVA
ncbi:MAG: hypothetical protein ACRDHN_01370 [Thermomicrobiales bacterium]